MTYDVRSRRHAPRPNYDHQRATEGRPLQQCPPLTRLDKSEDEDWGNAQTCYAQPWRQQAVKRDKADAKFSKLAATVKRSGAKAMGGGVAARR